VDIKGVIVKSHRVLGKVKRLMSETKESTTGRI
jgi:hypothetical protein